MTITPTALDALFTARHSCRAFRPDLVARDVIEQIISTAQRVPSWCNAQPWDITVTSGAETDRLRTALQGETTTATAEPDVEFPTAYTGFYQQRRRACGWQLYDAVGVEKGDRAGSTRQTMQNFSLFDAPHCAILSSPKDLGSYGALDCGGFITGFCLAAQTQGVASIAQAAVAAYSPFLHRHFDIANDRQILCAISFGYEDADHDANNFRTPRADLGAFVDWRG